jgi:two-component system phosphate regulon sensor histidine kinase PhoR
MQRNAGAVDSSEVEAARKNMTFAFSIGNPGNTPATVDSLHGKSASIRPAANEFRLQFPTGAEQSDVDMQKGISRVVAEFTNPFRNEALDSILSAALPALEYALAPLAAGDTAAFMQTEWKMAGGLLHSSLEVRYMYSPLERKGICIRAALPPQPVFARMAFQLLLALGLVLLLVGCLVFQIKTILKQKKITELRENFVNTMIHELRRPVQTLKTFLAFLGDRDLRSDEEATRQVVQDSMFEIDNLAAYLGKLRDIIRTDSGATPLHITKFNLEELVAKVIRLTPPAEGKDVQLSAIYEQESPWVEADPVHVANILGNLIENAVKYSAKEVKVEIKVEIKALAKGRELWLSVTDNGIGIPFAEQEKVFGKFYRASNLPDKNIPGLGLGLSYVKLIMEAHHGSVSLRSRPGEGASIQLFFPQ